MGVGWEDVGELVFTLVYWYISCQQFGVYVSCWVSLGPLGPGLGGCMSVSVYIGIVYIVPTIGGLYVSSSLH